MTQAWFLLVEWLILLLPALFVILALWAYVGIAHLAAKYDPPVWRE